MESFFFTIFGHCINVFHERGLDMRWYIANEARSVELAIIISYPTSANGIIVLLKKQQNIDKDQSTNFIL